MLALESSPYSPNIVHSWNLFACISLHFFPCLPHPNIELNIRCGARLVVMSTISITMHTHHTSARRNFITETSHLSLSDAGRDKAASAVTARDTRHQTTRPSPRPQLWFFVRFQLLLYINYQWLYSWSWSITVVLSHFMHPPEIGMLVNKLSQLEVVYVSNQ